ncbi:MAG TPA: hypothetical protein VGR57_07955 [Ktedonobacterales bacterium]|nr:hypothetical protein [Ktedonobacterales bacterium]
MATMFGLGQLIRLFGSDDDEDFPSDGNALSKEEQQASLGLHWEHRDYDAAYDQALAKQQHDALEALRLRRAS